MLFKTAKDRIRMKKVELEKLLKENLAVLVALQWSNTVGDLTPMDACPCCNCVSWRGHDKNCELHIQIEKTNRALNVV